MAGHTPGPWEVHPGDAGTVRGPVVGVERCTAAVAVVRYALRSNAEAEANARLISAAPELLSCVYAALGWFDGMLVPMDAPIRAKLEAAIAFMKEDTNGR